MGLSIQEAYVVLGVPYGSDEADCRKAYRRLISAWHPDRNDSPEAHGKTLKFNAAIAVLEKTGFQAESNGYDRSFHFQDEPYERDRYQHQNPFRYDYAEPVKSARTISRKVKLTIEEAAFGSIHNLSGKTSNVCRQCGGQKHTDQKVHCKDCNGSGRERVYFGRSEYCRSCNGYGYRYVECPGCRGTGNISGSSYSFGVNIPPGVRDGNVLLARGVGGLGSDGKTRADAKITIELLEHPLFAFDDLDQLWVDVPVLLTELLRGDSIIIPTLYGPQTLTLKPRQRHYLMPGLGFPNRRGEPEALHVEIEIAIPTTLNESMARLLDEVERELLHAGDEHFLECLERRRKRKEYVEQNASSRRGKDAG